MHKIEAHGDSQSQGVNTRGVTPAPLVLTSVLCSPFERPSLCFPSCKEQASPLICHIERLLYTEHRLGTGYPKLTGPQNSHGEIEPEKPMAKPWWGVLWKCRQRAYTTIRGCANTKHWPPELPQRIVLVVLCKHQGRISFLALAFWLLK